MNLNVVYQQTGYWLAHPKGFSKPEYRSAVYDLDYPETKVIGKFIEPLNSLEQLKKV